MISERQRCLVSSSLCSEAMFMVISLSRLYLWIFFLNYKGNELFFPPWFIEKSGYLGDQCMVHVMSWSSFSLRYYEWLQSTKLSYENHSAVDTMLKVPGEEKCFLNMYHVLVEARNGAFSLLTSWHWFPTIPDCLPKQAQKLFVLDSELSSEFSNF